MKIFCGIDGTNNDDSLPGPIATSYVKRIGASGFDRTKYVPGTKNTIWGSDSGDKARDAASWVLEVGEGKFQGATRTKVYLSGFSRGAVSAIFAAHLLNDQGVMVDAMFLFDAVDRTRSISNRYSQTIPKNVRMAYHVFRDPEGGSRRQFGDMNDSLRQNGPNLTVKKVLTTHGAVGGWRNSSDNLVDRPDWTKTFHDVSNNSTPAQIFHRSVYWETKEFTGPSAITPKQQMQGQNESLHWMTSRVHEELAR